ncbi:hypothetical protein [Limosilactobacillus fermentum]|uniref:hypothetical protein n=1 Tax=Limosilactobacillus fermentum TaxID=1613 RepID=UPI002F268522
MGKYNFKRHGIAKFDLVSDDLAEVVAGAQIILVAVPSVGHQTFFERLVPLLEDGQIIHILSPITSVAYAYARSCAKPGRTST